VNEKFRNKKIGKWMAQIYLFVARDLGYVGSFFNLVYVSNVASVKLWRELNFTQTGLVPKAGKLKGHDELVDAFQFYYDFSKVPPTPYKNHQ